MNLGSDMTLYAHTQLLKPKFLGPILLTEEYNDIIGNSLRLCFWFILSQSNLSGSMLVKRAVAPVHIMMNRRERCRFW